METISETSISRRARINAELTDTAAQPEAAPKKTKTRRFGAAHMAAPCQARPATKGIVSGYCDRLTRSGARLVFLDKKKSRDSYGSVGEREVHVRDPGLARAIDKAGGVASLREKSALPSPPFPTGTGCPLNV